MGRREREREREREGRRGSPLAVSRLPVVVYRMHIQHTGIS